MNGVDMEDHDQTTWMLLGSFSNDTQQYDLFPSWKTLLFCHSAANA